MRLNFQKKDICQVLIMKVLTKSGFHCEKMPIIYQVIPKKSVLAYFAQIDKLGLSSHMRLSFQKQVFVKC